MRDARDGDAGGALGQQIERGGQSTSMTAAES
jgi:hypothetical protein